ncbi:hypothetical protein N7462_009638 [Penicillium macrosclerotiorum]|uniref:uncharacterized protein n=1 Tax=Penicillium macrosclerotiorum TaxID=303699 RepID=UPI002546ABD9|nr:uncharacterized protein N7462_009638 [Penicillium macrosclerotiorum]KAJ5674199.1 hypothetical protein N7462_009638 [Penicillium macrosclerotiorum]
MPAPAEEAIRTVSALATQLGNQISVYMLNYLSTTNDLPDGFRELSHTFLDTCRTLWAIEAGVTELAGANRALPEVIINEVEKKFVAAYRDFQHLEKVILKLVQYEHRGTLGKLQRGWHRPGHELNRIHESLKKTNETLQISGMAFHWSLGEAHPEESVGIGYASLAAALDRIAKGRSVMGINKVMAIEHDQSVSSFKSVSPNSIHSSPSVPPKESPATLRSSPRYLAARESSQDNTHDPESIADDMSSILSLNCFLNSHPSQEAETSPPLEHRPLPPHPTKTSSAASLAEINTRRVIDLDPSSRKSGKPGPLTSDAFSKPRHVPHQSIPSGGPKPRTSIASALRGRDHTLLEQLLSSGMSPDKQDHFHPLNEAVIQRDIENIRLLLLFKANPNIPDSQGKTPLTLTVEQTFVDGAVLLLQHGADANYKVKGELESLLAVSIANNNLELTQLLLAHGSNPNEETRNGTNLLIEAIRERTSHHLVEILLDAGCDPNYKDNQGKTALCEAVQSDQPSIVKALLDHHANPNLPGPEHALWSAVHHPDCLHILLSRGADIRKTPGIMEQATSVNSIDAVGVLLEAGVDPNCKKDGTYTPLCSAIRDDRPDIVALLLSHGADPNLMASEYPAWKCITHNRLHFLPDLVTAGADLRYPPGIAECAVQFNNPEALHWVVEQGGANPNDRNDLGRTALTTAIRENRPEMVKWLLAHGTDPSIRGQDWPVYMATRSPTLLRLLLPAITDLAAHKGVMEKAVQANQLESVKLLLAAGASVEWKNGGVFSPLTTALRERHSAIVHFLLSEGGADPNAPGEHLPIVKAIRRCDDGDFSMIELLLEKGADPNKCYRGWNSIMQTIENRDLRLLQLLIEKGGPVDFTQKDEAGQTVLDMAEASGWPEGTQLLLKNARSG